MARYILQNKEDYVFSALTASLDGEVCFKPLEAVRGTERVGLLHVPMDTRFIVNDGQHRRAAIEMAIRENPELADEDISVVLFIDKGLERCQQMFADLNRYAVRPSRSLGLLYDHRDEMAIVTRKMVAGSDFFRDMVEMEKSSLSPRSPKLFIFSSLYTANSALIGDLRQQSSDSVVDLIFDYWARVAQLFPEWQLVSCREMSAGEVRREFLHSHGIALHAIAKVGHWLMRECSDDWRARLEEIGALDWSRRNTSLWEGRAMIGGKVSKAGNNLTLTVNAIKKHLDISLTPAEQRIEDALLGEENAT
jgi:DNA sulfur modification protein DndB